MGTRKQTWCDHCGKEGPVEGVQLTTTRQKRSTEAPANPADLCSGCLERAVIDFNFKKKFTDRPAVKKRP